MNPQEKYEEAVRVEMSRIPYRRRYGHDHPYTGCDVCDTDHRTRAEFNLAMKGTVKP